MPERGNLNWTLKGRSDLLCEARRDQSSSADGQGEGSCSITNCLVRCVHDEMGLKKKAPARDSEKAVYAGEGAGEGFKINTTKREVIVCSQQMQCFRKSKYRECIEVKQTRRHTSEFSN